MDIDRVLAGIPQRLALADLVHEPLYLTPLEWDALRQHVVSRNAIPAPWDYDKATLLGASIIVDRATPPSRAMSQMMRAEALDLDDIRSQRAEEVDRRARMLRAFLTPLPASPPVQPPCPAPAAPVSWWRRIWARLKR